MSIFACDRQVKFSEFSEGKAFFRENPHIGTVKSNGHYYHLVDGELKVFSTKSAVRKILSAERSGKWIEEKEGKRRHFIDESGWFQPSYREVSIREFEEKSADTTWQKTLGIALGILALTPGLSELVRHIPKEGGFGCLAIQHKFPASGLLCALSQVDAKQFQVNTYTPNLQQDPSVAAL